MGLSWLRRDTTSLGVGAMPTLPFHIPRRRENLRALCVGRHRFIAEHFGRVFGGFGLETAQAVGVREAVRAARRHQPHVVICDYELLATQSLGLWERDARLSRTPVIGASMTRRPEELNPMDINDIAGFIYLPQLTDECARHLFSGVCPPAPYSPVSRELATAGARKTG